MQLQKNAGQTAQTKKNCAPHRSLKKCFYQLVSHICATRLVKLCNLKKMVCQFKMNMCVDAKLKATSCATTCIVVPTDDNFCAISKKSDQTSTCYLKKKKLLKKQRELTCNLPNTPGEIVSFLITLAIRVLSHAFDRITQLLTGMSWTNASRYSIFTRPNKKKRQVQLLL